jgi:hypothetical protein
MTDNPPAPLPAIITANLRAASRQPACHRCGTVATSQWPRASTDAEREQHWAAVEAHIRSIPDLFGGQNAEYTADRSEPVTKAVFGCDEHDLSPAPADDSDEAIAAAEQAGTELRTLTHAADCGGHGACQCGGAE